MKPTLRLATIALAFLTVTIGAENVQAADAALRYRAATPKAARLACNQYGRCWDARLMSYEDFNSGQLAPARRVNRRAGTCMGYRWQYPIAWDECAGDYDHGDGYIYH